MASGLVRGSRSPARERGLEVNHLPRAGVEKSVMISFSAADFSPASAPVILILASLRCDKFAEFLAYAGSESFAGPAHYNYGIFSAAVRSPPPDALHLLCAERLCGLRRMRKSASTTNKSTM